MEHFYEKINKDILQLLKNYSQISLEDQQIIMNDLKDLSFFHIDNFGDLLNTGLFICDNDGIILYVNKENENLVGLKQEECIGKHYSVFTSSGGLSNVVVNHVLSTGNAYTSLAHSSITGIQLLENGTPIYDLNHHQIGALLSDQDISETFNLMERLKESESKIAQYEELTSNHSQIINQLNQQNIVARHHFSTMEDFKSPAIRETYALALQASKTDVTTLLVGETGTGKEVIADYIFENSSRNSRAFIKVNCSAIPEHLLESELFGYVRGAFTGACSHGKTGMFELANNGTLFLDEIGELPLEFQAKLLRAIQEKEITKVGDTKSIKLDLRIIAATNRNLEKMVEDGTFRSDLYYRLNIFPISTPPLRERKEDIPDMANHFLAIFNKKYNKNIILSGDTINGLCAYPWPGNIRELENLIERWAVIFEPYTSIQWSMVKQYFVNTTAQNELHEKKFAGHSWKELTAEYEREILEWAFETYGTTRAMAKALDVDHSTIVRKAQQLKIRRHETADSVKTRAY